jgi:hypothetical protein
VQAQRQTPPVPLAAPPLGVEERPATPVRTRLLGGGTDGNERLTSLVAAVLLVLLAVLGATIVRIGPLLSVHMFVGMLLIGPLAAKLASTGYRFVRYYTHDAAYVRKGPPPIALRLLAPVVVASTIVVFASGVVLLLAGPSSRDTWFPIHKLSFFAWLAVTAIHVLVHLPAVARSLSAEYRAAGVGAARFGGGLNGQVGRGLSLAGAVVLGSVLAVLAIGQFSPWLSSQQLHH